MDLGWAFTMTDKHLTYFTESEFERNEYSWLDKCHPKLIYLLDAYRRMWKAPVQISPHPKAIGRYKGDSYHNVDQHGWVMALDLMPHAMYDQRQVIEVSRIASNLGFGGFGLYPDWQPSPGIHIDIRPRDNKIVKWGGIDIKGDQHYVTFHEALMKFPD